LRNGCGKASLEFQVSSFKFQVAGSGEGRIETTEGEDDDEDERGAAGKVDAKTRTRRSASLQAGLTLTGFESIADCGSVIAEWRKLRTEACGPIRTTGEQESSRTGEQGGLRVIDRSKAGRL
jgi:hypothetical protein